MIRYIKFATFTAFLKKLKFFSEKPKKNCSKKTNGVHFEKSLYLSCIVRQICYKLVMKNIQPPDIRMASKCQKAHTSSGKKQIFVFVGTSPKLSIYLEVGRYLNIFLLLKTTCLNSALKGLKSKMNKSKGPKVSTAGFLAYHGQYICFQSPFY